MNNLTTDDKNSGDETHRVDRLVGAFLEHRADQVDAQNLTRRILLGAAGEAPMLSKVADEQVSDSIRPTPIDVVPSERSYGSRRTMMRTLWVMATAALIMIAFAFGRWESSAYASATRLVKAARTTHAMALERCYLVSTKILSASAGEDSKQPISGFFNNVRIWTQGNRFWVDVTQSKRRWAWGRNAEGSVWLALGHNRGLQIDAAELGRPLEQLCDLYSLELDSLLENFQSRWTLTNRETTDSSHIVSAQPKRGGFHRVTGATIEIDRETKAIRRLTIQRTSTDGLATEVDFVLVETRVPDESLYQLEGHLNEPHQVFTRSNLATKRREVLKSWFGTGSEQWIREP